MVHKHCEPIIIYLVPVTVAVQPDHAIRVSIFRQQAHTALVTGSKHKLYYNIGEHELKDRENFD